MKALAPQHGNVRHRNAEATRQALLDAATSVFAEVGFAGARVDDIAARADVNKRMLYAYFGDKEGLYREVLASRFGRVTELTRAAIAERDPRVEAEAFLACYFKLLNADLPFSRLLCWELLSGDRARELLVESALPSLELVQDALYRGAARGDFRADLDPEMVGASLVAITLGYFLQRSALVAARAAEGKRMWRDDEVLAHTLKLFFYGIGAEGARAVDRPRSRSQKRPGAHR